MHCLQPTRQRITTLRLLQTALEYTRISLTEFNGQSLIIIDMSATLSESESECKCLTCNQKPTGSQFSLLHEPN